MIRTQLGAARSTLVTLMIAFAFTNRANGQSPVNAAPIRRQLETAIIHGRIVDGNGGAPIQDGTIVFRGDQIVAVGPFQDVKVPANARVIDATAKTVMPGLADLHVHLGGGWDGSGSDYLSPTRWLNSLLYAGVTEILDTGNFLSYMQQLRQEVASGRLQGPAIHFLGPLIDGMDPTYPEVSFVVGSASQMPDIVKKLKQGHVDGLKAYVGLSPRLIAALVQAAKAESLQVFVDAGAAGNGTSLIAQTGINVFAHIGTIPLTDELIVAMRDRHIATLTTLVAFEFSSGRRLHDLKFLDDSLVINSLPPRAIAELAAYAQRPRTATDSFIERRQLPRFRTGLANLRRLVDAGVLVAAGTDGAWPGLYYGQGLHRELELFVESGLTPLQAITLATKNAALVLKEASIWGTLEAGKRADILIINGDPTIRISETRNIALVIQGGRVLDRNVLRYDHSRDPGFLPAK